MSEPVVIVTGATGGIGRALVHRLHRRGARLVLAARGAEQLTALAEEVGALAHPVDVTDASQVDALVAAAIRAHGTIDGVAHCVGSILLRPAHLTSDADWATTMAINLTSAFHVLRAVVKQHRGAASLAFVSTAAAQVGLPNHEAISAAKGGLEALVRTAAATYATRGVRVNAVAPGLVRTPLAARITGSETALAASIKLHPLGRVGEPEDVARAIDFLLDQENSWITGQMIAVDGGMSALRSMG
jgi:NAD(P)-dependent dehydrogenase (short-subunit alcohol dehydrogenase family)